MKHRKPGSIVFVILAALLFFLCAALTGEIQKSRSLNRSLAYYREKLEGIEPVSPVRLEELKKELTALKKTEPEATNPKGHLEQPPRLIHSAAAVRSLLRENRIQPEGFRITGQGKEESAEFILRCAPENFLNFLLRVEDNPAIRIDYMSIKPTSGEADITLRIKHDP